MKEWRETEGLSVAHGCGRIQETKPGLSWIGQRKQRFGSLPTFLIIFVDTNDCSGTSFEFPFAFL